MYLLKEPAAMASPALLVYHELVEENIRKMITMAGGPERLMPHVKTHKMPQVVLMQRKHGIQRFKCATFAEAQMLAETGAKDVLMAYQLNTPTAEAFAELAVRFPNTAFASVVDNVASAQLLSRIFSEIRHSRKPIGFSKHSNAHPLQAQVYIDIDNGMHRTGISPDKALALCEEIRQLPALHVRGLHVYDGHLRESDLLERTRQCNEAFAPVAELAAAMGNPEIVAGGTPTFPIHVLRKDVICSPGTCILWDEGYGSSLPEQHFTPAAILFTRVISKPLEGHVTLDLGHKAVSAENPVTKRVFFHDLGEYEVISQSEEHLVVKTSQAESLQVGDVLYGIPWHVCPTVALYNEAQIITGDVHTGTWPIARGRKIINSTKFSTK
ncbi:D-TA family PLP-dependent enzyme [Chitinophaga lutea]|uniref:D-TA family PLP-dependent enzyme n=1 Tax=Chitinophaga lutea TaxID=2488634 RepID=A0A3N4PZU2_9BACT|nr:D-TA family PLP-dependent enzyme [Chitinophaga lutea]RPE14272.1 D-TA family PLP-dependent enzyme [Chitinophaga lutea]